ncbi:leucine-rich repeat-containing protein 73 [Aplysia californica]|uniref:Leucine-rich repeat-containing protein 73 n=1 Tax=Aplysia californica TaxID=6500 RepID=A0ABM1AAT0_APLCA|nr:leucine-rich repeat-containing protein 73 [Aplysia californica]
MEALRKSPSDPVMLNLSLNPLTSGSVDYILETVKTKPSLEAVVLQGSRLGDEGVKQLVEGLLYNHAQTKKLSSEEEEGSDSGKKELQELDLSDCKFGDVGAGAVAKLLNSDMDVDTLTLSYNHAISSQGWSLIGNALNGNRNLQTLTLDHNFIGNDGLQCLCSGLYDNRSLTALDLNDVGLSQAGGATLNELLKRNTTILEITLTGNRLTDEQIDNVQKYIALNKSVNPEVEDSIRN